MVYILFSYVPKTFHPTHNNSVENKLVSIVTKTFYFVRGTFCCKFRLGTWLMEIFEAKLKVDAFIFGVQTLLEFNIQHNFFNIEH